MPARYGTIPPAPHPGYAKMGMQEGTRLQAIQNAFMLDTSAGQFTIFAATAKAYGVPLAPAMRRVQQGYSPLDDDLIGFEQYLDEFQESTSPEETMMIKQMIENNLDLRTQLEDWGAIRFGAGLIDPINIIPIPFGMGKGFYQGIKSALARGTPIVAGTEVARHMIDPTSTFEETLFATVGGSLFMGLIGGGVGLMPKKTIHVSDALNKLTPPPGTTGMSIGLPFHMGSSSESIFKAITRSLKNAAGYGEPAWKKVNPDDMRLDINDDFGDQHLLIRMLHKSGERILEGIDNGESLQINGVFVPKEMQRQGFASYAVKQAVEYAESKGLRIVSDTAMTEDAMKFWAALDKAGFNIKENKNWETGGLGGRRSTDGEPLFEAVQQIDPEQIQVPKHVREELADLTDGLKKQEAEHIALRDAINVLKKKVKDAPEAGGAKTKAKQQLKEAKKAYDETFAPLDRTRTIVRDREVGIAAMLDEAVVKDWDLFAVGYGEIIAKTDQFPWWSLIKNNFRKSHPEIAVKLQLFALKMAASPGLNNHGNRLGHSSGPSVDSLTIEYTGAWLVAAREAGKIYRKYAGFGEDSGQVKHFTIDSVQRIRGFIARRSGEATPTTTLSGKLTVKEFDRQISIAIADRGKHSVPEVAKAAIPYINVLKRMGEEGKRLEVFATQKAINNRIAFIERQLRDFDEKWGKKYDVGDMDDQVARFQELNAELKALDELEADVQIAEESFLGGMPEPNEPDFIVVDDVTGEVIPSERTERINASTTVNPRRAEIEAELSEFYARDRPQLPPSLRNTRDNYELEKVHLIERMDEYKATEDLDFIHRIWLHDEVVAQKELLKKMLFDDFIANPKEVRLDAQGQQIVEHPEIIQARVNEAYAAILHEAETGSGSFGVIPNEKNKRNWLLARQAAVTADDTLPERTQIKQLQIIQRRLDNLRQNENQFGAMGPLIARRLNLNNKVLLEAGLIEGDITTWMNRYVQSVAPVIETARVFGDGRAMKAIEDIIGDIIEEADKLPEGSAERVRMMAEAERVSMHMNDLRDIVHGTFAIPDNPDALTGRVLRILRNFNILGAMGRSVMMALGDIGNTVVSQGFIRSMSHAIETFAGGVTDGNIKMIRDEVDLAGSVSEVILGMRYHQMTDFGSTFGTGSTKYPKIARFEQATANMSQRFFLYNLLGPWTDMARRFSGGMLQSRLIENSILWREGRLHIDEQEIMGRLFIHKEQAIQFAEEWEAAGSLKHNAMFIAGTSNWSSENAIRVFRAAMNNEINRMIPTPGAVDKPKALLKSEWWKVIGQYRGFSIAATHRIFGAGLHQRSATKYSGLASMVGIAMMVDAFKRPDYMQMPMSEQVLRAVELSGVTGIFLDINDTVERATAGGFGVRPALGMDIRERSPNWANRMGTIGAVPNQWLTLMYGLTSDDAETDDLARSIRYMIPYNNLLWWNEVFNRAQRSSVDFFEDTNR